MKIEIDLPAKHIALITGIAACDNVSVEEWIRDAIYCAANGWRDADHLALGSETKEIESQTEETPPNSASMVREQSKTDGLTLELYPPNSTSEMLRLLWIVSDRFRADEARQIAIYNRVVDVFCTDGGAGALPATDVKTIVERFEAGERPHARR